MSENLVPESEAAPLDPPVDAPPPQKKRIRDDLKATVEDQITKLSNILKKDSIDVFEHHLALKMSLQLLALQNAEVMERMNKWLDEAVDADRAGRGIKL